MSNRFKRSSSAIVRDNIMLAFGIAVAAPLAVTASAIAAPSSPGGLAPEPSARYAQNVSPPLIFEANVGQASGEALFLARGRGTHILINAAGFDILPEASKNQHLETSPFSFKFVGAATDSHQLALEKTGGVSRYYGRAKTPDQALTADHYRRVSMGSLYPGIDIVYYGTDRNLEYDFVLAPHADPRQIEISVTGIDSAALDSDGNLNLVKGERTFSQKKPLAFQEIAEGVRKSVEARYVLARADDGALRVALDLGAYDHSSPLIIDPLVLSFSRTLGGLGYSYANSVAADNSGNIYVAGASFSTNFPGAYAGPVGIDPYVSKLGASGDVIYTTFLQTNGAGGEVNGIAVDAQGNAYVAGTTRGTLLGQVVNGTSDAFAAKLGASGEVGYLTLLGGSGDDVGSAVKVDLGGNAYVAGTTYTLLGQVVNGGSDAFITKLGASGQTIYESSFGSYFGPASQYSASAVALGSSGDAWVAGSSTVCNGSYDAFFAHVAVSGVPSSYKCLGGSGDDFASGIGLDGYGNLYISGNTRSVDFPIVAPFQSAHNDFGFNNGFLAKYNLNTNNLVQSSYLGGSGSGYIDAKALAVDLQGNAYVAGGFDSNALPVLGGGFQQTYAGQMDAFIMKVGSSGSLDYSTYLGGSGDDWAGGLALSNDGRLTVVGMTRSMNYPVTGAAQPMDIAEAFVTQLQFSATNTVINTAINTSDCIFNWVETIYPAYFSPAATSATYTSYYYRYYSGTGNYLITSSADNNLYVLGAATGNSLLNVGLVTDFLGVSGCQQTVAPSSTGTVVEFYNTTLDNYFITADANEAAQIDGGSAGSGWSRTGNSFKSGGNTSVCRFYGSYSPGPNSHFYTVDPGECQGLKDQQIPAGDPLKLTVKSWNFESLDFVSTPATNLTCPTGTTPVYRAYNNGYARGVDSNHRITSSTTAIQEVVTRGWSNEGVVMCAPN